MVRLSAPRGGAAQGVGTGLAAPGLNIPHSGPRLGHPGQPEYSRSMPADPMLVGRRHVDLQRVRSAICCDAR
ncbi:putative leader peptide [Nonomuraea insulae]|uniref:putative leader peptide n=1 Tax=Nonomuraea insulae TaxID=1616787 RepID=UPI0036D278D6